MQRKKHICNSCEVKCAIRKSKDLFENGYMTSAAVTFKKQKKRKQPEDN